MMEWFDEWIIIEGHAKNGGSTSWCKDLDVPPRSTDGTHEFLKDLKGVHYFSKGDYWESKDEMGHKAIEILKTLTDECYLWQVDVDEVWQLKGIINNERALKVSVGNCGKVQFHHIVGKIDNDLLVAKGKWGSGYVNRVWEWKGEEFISHEPSVMDGQKAVSLPQKFEHYSLYFEDDVKFKSKYYKGYENLHENWTRMHRKGIFPCSISELLGEMVGPRTTKVYRQVRR